MENPYEFLIKDTTYERFLRCNLTLNLELETRDVQSPRDYAKTSFVGGEIEIPKHINQGLRIEDFVENYCREVLKCKPDDIIWAEVNKHEHHSKTYSLKPFGWSFSNSTAGIIYISKADVRKDYGVKRVTKSLEDTVISRFADELKRYTQWVNGRVYLAAIKNDKDEVIDMHGELYNVADDIDNEINDMLNHLGFSSDCQEKS